MRVSRQNTPPLPYSICKTQLTSVTSFKYLGVDITSNLSWITHSDLIISNANSAWIFKKTLLFNPYVTRTSSVQDFIHSKLEHAVATWDPGLSTLATNIEALQNRATSFIICNYHRTASASSIENHSVPLLPHAINISFMSLYSKI
uniref:Putative endonuclease/reverse transcriptase n=1 Tax=Ixodes ricinus TaxID=34613 RepID=V5HH69_IXORI